MNKEFLKNFKEYTIATAKQKSKELWDIEGILKGRSNKKFKFDLTPMKKLKNNEIGREGSTESKADKIVIEAKSKWIILDSEELNNYINKNKLKIVHLNNILSFLDWTIYLKK
jgi:oligoribonuclease NrnB/cAMP/cGMP phosphodiesterase (DHH superfamily)